MRLTPIALETIITTIAEITITMMIIAKVPKNGAYGFETALKLAVTVPPPFTVAVVESDDWEAKVIGPVASHDENA